MKINVEHACRMTDKTYECLQELGIQENRAEKKAQDDPQFAEQYGETIFACNGPNEDGSCGLMRVLPLGDIIEGIPEKSPES